MRPGDEFHLRSDEAVTKALGGLKTNQKEKEVTSTDKDILRDVWASTSESVNVCHYINHEGRLLCGGDYSYPREDIPSEVEGSPYTCANCLDLALSDMANRALLSHAEKAAEGLSTVSDILSAAADPNAPTVTNERGGGQSHIPVRFDLIDAKALFAVSGVLHEGASKYGAGNWRLIPVRDHLNHLLTHVYAYLSGDQSDDHLSHAVCRALFALGVDLDPQATPEKDI